MKIILTGATGYLGSELLARLLLESHDVTVLKRHSSKLSRIEQYLDRIKTVDVDMVKLDQVFKAECFDMVIHAATCYGKGKATVADVISTNLFFSLNLLQYAIQFKIPRFINLNTGLVKYTNSYSLAKTQFMEWGEYFSGHGKIYFDNLELQNFYGPGEDNSKFVSFVIEKILNNKPLDLTAGTQKRDFLFISDMVDAIMSVLNYPLEAKCSRNFELGSGDAISIRALVEQIALLSPGNHEINLGKIAMRENEPSSCVANIDAILSLGWKQKVGLEEGLGITYKHAQTLLVEGKN